MLGPSRLLNRILYLVPDPMAIPALPTIGGRIKAYLATFYLDRQEPMLGMSQDKIGFPIPLATGWSEARPRAAIVDSPRLRALTWPTGRKPSPLQICA